MNRVEIARALAKAQAYKQCGKDALANAWAARLITLLQAQDILTDDARAIALTMEG